MADFMRNRLQTSRLELVAATPEHIHAELLASVALGAILDADVGPGWPPGEYDRGAQEFFLERLQKGGTDAAGWYSWYALARNNATGRNIAIGAGGYCGPPGEEGEVEIGFSVLPQQQRRNYATEMAAALILNAFADPRVHAVIAHAAGENAASRSVLRKCCFACLGPDGESGYDRFVLERTGGKQSVLRQLTGM